MKNLLLFSSLFILATACSSDPKSDYQERQEEIQSEYNETVDEAGKDRDESLKEAEEEFRESQKEEAYDYVDESRGVDVNKDEQVIGIEE